MEIMQNLLERSLQSSSHIIIDQGCTTRGPDPAPMEFYLALGLRAGYKIQETSPE